MPQMILRMVLNTEKMLTNCKAVKFTHYPFRNRRVQLCDVTAVAVIEISIGQLFILILLLGKIYKNWRMALVKQCRAAGYLASPAIGKHGLIL